jgi:prevent-host-death family protein
MACGFAQSIDPDWTKNANLTKSVASAELGSGSTSTSINEFSNQATAKVEPSIGAFEAKAQLSRLLRAFEAGEQFTITVRGRPVADLVSHRTTTGAGRNEAIAALQAFPRIQGIPDDEVACFVAEGRL